MKKAEYQHRNPVGHAAAQHGGGVTVESPQSKEISQLESMADGSQQAERQLGLAARIHSSPAMTAQRRLIDTIAASPLMALQRLEGESESPAPLEQQPLSRPNRTGLPDNLKSGIESLSGVAMDGVNVHYNSPRPAQLNALAYAQGTEIHLAPGQEQHLPHEAWHVVQQAQGRVQPTMQMRGDVPVNDDRGLEHEADVMGRKAAALGHSDSAATAMTTAAVALQRMPVAQMAWATENYTVSDDARTLHVDTKSVNWGATARNQFVNHRDDANRPRAILYETMGRPADVAGLLGAFRNAPVWDVGLSLVVNRAYTPAKIYQRDAKTATKANKTTGVTAPATRGQLDTDWTNITNGWNGPPLQVTVAAWERREVENDAGTGLEIVQGSVPYSTLRRIAAVNPGSAAIDHELYSNHSSVWRKMGDSDMPVVDPNDGNSAEMAKLKDVEDEGVALNKNTLVTFGYNLTTPGTTPMVASILANIYKKEMQLRDKIGEAGGPLYPSEPTTYYRPRAEGTMDAAWNNMEKEKVGGSGQQLEGAKLARSMGKNGGILHKADHSIAADTGAGARNDALVQLLEGWWQNGNGNHDDVVTARIIDEINNLDQSALRDGEYLGKVPTNLGIQLEQQQHEEIATLVQQYRKQAAVEAATTLVTALTRGRKWQ